METVLTLIHTETAQDSRGVWKETATPREVFCKVISVTRTEFFDGGRSGLNPEYQATVFHGDYWGKQVRS